MQVQTVGRVPDELRVRLGVWLTLLALTAASFALMYAGALLIFGALGGLAEALTGYALRAGALESASAWLGAGCFATGVFVFACLVRGSLEAKRPGR
jgi:hypothetical protein